MLPTRSNFQLNTTPLRRTRQIPNAAGCGSGNAGIPSGNTAHQAAKVRIAQAKNDLSCRMVLISSAISAEVIGMRHDLINSRSLELNRLVAGKIHRQPELMDFVRSNLKSTLDDQKLSDSCKDALKEWDYLLRNFSTDIVLDTLVEESERGQRLRQSSPFWGILTQEERRQVFRQHESAGA